MGESRQGKNGRYRQQFRQRERDQIKSWIKVGASGSVVGLAGAGKSNLLIFLCDQHRSQEKEGLGDRHVAFVPVDLNDLPEKNLATLYRTILRAFHEQRRHFNEALQETISNRYRENRAVVDPFVLQSALRELLLHMREQFVQVVLVLDRFDDFCRHAEVHMTNTLKGLRDQFKQTLCYIVGMRQEAAYLPVDKELGELRELIDSHICWVGPMNRLDTAHMLKTQAEHAGRKITEPILEKLWQLTGGYPSFVRVASDWWCFEGYKIADLDEWETRLLNHPSMQHRLQEIWNGLPSDEQELLTRIRLLQDASATSENEFKNLRQKQQHFLRRLQNKGLLRPKEVFFSSLFAAYILSLTEGGQEAITQNEQTGEIFKGPRPLRNLTALERSLLIFMIQNPHVQLTKTELIVKAWPNEMHQNEGIRDDSLYQVISGLRRKLGPSADNRPYIVTWRGVPEGGYQFFPEGQPEEK